MGIFTRESNAHNWTETSGLRIPNELGLYDMSGNVLGVVLGLVWRLFQYFLEGPPWPGFW